MLYQTMQWWDKVAVTVDFIWLFLFLVLVIACLVVGYNEAKKVDKMEENIDEYLDEYERDLENMKVERKGWKTINEDLRQENEDLKRKNMELVLEKRSLSMQLEKLVQSYKVVTLDDLQKGLESYHMRMMDYINEQDQALAAYTTGNLFVKNTETLQNRLDALSNAELCICNAKNYISAAIAVCSKE